VRPHELFTMRVVSQCNILARYESCSRSHSFKSNHKFLSAVLFSFLFIDIVLTMTYRLFKEIFYSVTQ
jgi:hypothetical protein